MAASFPSVPDRTNTVTGIRAEVEQVESTKGACVTRWLGALLIPTINWQLSLKSKSNNTHAE